MTRRRFTEARGGRGYFEDAEPAERPPIVFITVDMVPPDFYRREEINGGIARTPNIDRLRAGGVEFTNADPGALRLFSDRHKTEK